MNNNTENECLLCGGKCKLYRYPSKNLTEIVCDTCGLYSFTDAVFYVQELSYCELLNMMFYYIKCLSKGQPVHFVNSEHGSYVSTQKLHSLLPRSEEEMYIMILENLCAIYQMDQPIHILFPFHPQAFKRIFMIDEKVKDPWEKMINRMKVLESYGYVECEMDPNQSTKLKALILPEGRNKVANMKMIRTAKSMDRSRYVEEIKRISSYGEAFDTLMKIARDETIFLFEEDTPHFLLEVIEILFEKGALLVTTIGFSKETIVQFKRPIPPYKTAVLKSLEPQNGLMGNVHVGTNNGILFAGNDNSYQGDQIKFEGDMSTFDSDEAKHRSEPDEKKKISLVSKLLEHAGQFIVAVAAAIISGLILAYFF